MTGPECPRCGEPIAGPETGFLVINRRLNIVGRIVAAAERIEDGATDEAHGVLVDLERDLAAVIHPDEWRRAA